MNWGIGISLISIAFVCFISIICIFVSMLDIQKINEEIEKSDAEPLFGRKSSKKKKTENSTKEDK